MQVLQDIGVAISVLAVFTLLMMPVNAYSPKSDDLTGSVQAAPARDFAGTRFDLPAD